MSNVVALAVLVSEVNADLKTRQRDLETAFGFRAPLWQQHTTKRIVWTPGDEAGSLGKELGATKAPIAVGANQTARNLADLDELFHVQIQAHDPSCPDDELGQYTYTRLLFDAWRAAVHRATHGTKNIGQFHSDQGRWELGQTRYTKGTSNEFRRGATLVITCRIRCPIPDGPVSIAHPVAVNLSPATDDVQAPTLTIPIELEET